MVSDIFLNYWVVGSLRFGVYDTGTGRGHCYCYYYDYYHCFPRSEILLNPKPEALR